MGTLEAASNRAPSLRSPAKETLMFKRAVWSVVALLVASSIAIQVFAQTPGQQGKGQTAPVSKLPGNLPGSFTFIPKADVEKVQTAIENGLPNDAPVRMVNVSNRFNLGVYTLNSRPSKPPAPGAPVMGFYHNDIAEVYIVASGAGIWRVGGELENPKPDDLSGRSVKEVRGPGVVGVLKGYTNQKITAGDVLIVPAGVPHSPGEMMETTKIIRIVIDPHKVLPIFPPTGQTSSAAPPPAPAKPLPKLAGTFTFIPKAEIDKTLKETEAPGAYGDRAVRTVDLPALNFRVGVYVIHRAKPSDNVPASGWYHTHIAEIYYVLRGAGTFMAGGSLENPTEDDPNSYSTKVVRGPSVSGTFKGVTEQKIEAGDLLIAPIGVPHVTGKATVAPRDIMRIAFDPDKVLPLK
jgi:mannose-6-phosphate isomerase-like protein (cupin superfamily)